MLALGGKIKVMLFIGHYLPGFKSGGILRSVENLVNNFHDEFEFLIVTRDHDLGDEGSYPDIRQNQWQIVGKAQVYYLDQNSQSLKDICYLVNNTQCDLIYLNSFFDPLTVKVLFANKRSWIENKPVILSPRGEFAWASLKIKYSKKLIYIALSRLFSFYNDIIWHASTEYEKKDIIKVMNIDSRDIRIARDLPINFDTDGFEINLEKKDSASDYLRIVFLSRISPEKNLDYALKVLSKVQVEVEFDIYGTIENKSYWSKCQKYIDDLPSHVTVKYCGSVSLNESVNILAAYDLFLFPSGGENYGHVIAESLMAETPVLISDNTPWRELEEKNIGWDFSLNNMDCFVRIIEYVAAMSVSDRALKRVHIREVKRDFLLNQQDYEDNKQIFLQVLSRG